MKPELTRLLVVVAAVLLTDGDAEPAPGRGAKAFQNTVLCEYLAAHGSVVAASRALDELPHVDASRVGLIGYSWGGLAVPLAAMGEDETIGAVIALDPTIMVKSGHRLATSWPGYDPSAIRAPVMLPIAAAKQWKERDFGFFEETQPDRTQDDIDRIRIGYAALCRYVESFLAAHLEGDPEDNDIPGGVITVERR